MCILIIQINVISYINKLRDKNKVIILMDSEKVFDKIQHPFMIKKKKTLQKMGTEGTYLNMLLCLAAQPCPTFYDLKDCSPPGFSRPEHWSGLPRPPPGDLPNPGIEPRSPTLQADSLPAESPRKPMNTGVGSLSLLQGVLPIQESNQSLLHFRQILYQLSYQASPTST